MTASAEVGLYHEDELWSPVRNGPIYCSPRCGGMCKWTAYRKACDLSAALATDLGEGWYPSVWENLGWHWQVKNGQCEISDHRNRCTPHVPNWWCSLMVEQRQFQANGQTPREALSRVLSQVRQHVRKAQFAIDVLSDTCAPLLLPLSAEPKP